MPNLMRTSNPALNLKAFQGQGAVAIGERMTVAGTVNKTGILLCCAVLTAAWTWSRFLHFGANAVAIPIGVGAIGGLIFAIATIFKKEWSPITAPIYALLEGMVLGGLSAIVDARAPGIAIQAVTLTFGTLIVLLLAYRSGLIKVTDKFRLGVVAATGGIALLYVLTMVLGLFHIQAFAPLYQAGAIGIGFSLLVVVIASLNLVLDFDFIESAAQIGVPKYMEWYAGFGLMVTLIWLYLEILRLLSKLRSRR
jgi:uncharacterized YccA/Bax inhibitor family protein